tara:strand:+ start:6241 stop:6690 length:450 start_codon:yes stop_codon:yes gene_type:complete
MFKKVLLASAVFIVTSCTASISVKADPELYLEPSAPNTLNDKKDKNYAAPPTELPRNPTQQAMRIPCDNTEYVINLLEGYGEKKLFDAAGVLYMIPPGRPPQFAQPFTAPVSFYVNMDSGKWSMVVSQSGYTCLITVGTDFIAGGRDGG